MANMRELLGVLGRWVRGRKVIRWPTIHTDPEKWALGLLFLLGGVLMGY